MRKLIIYFLKTHPHFLKYFWKIGGVLLDAIGQFIPVKEKTMLFCSLGGRMFGDSPKAIYEEVCRRPELDDWDLIWAFDNPQQFEIPRGTKVRIDSFCFFYTLMYSKVWISNSGMSRGIKVQRKNTIQVETWHGTPLKKIGGEENQNSMLVKTSNLNVPLDATTIRCSQSEFDRTIFSRVFHCTKESILLSDLPRNDELLQYDSEMLNQIRMSLNIRNDAKVILYTPTYREYLIDENRDTYLAPPLDFKKWKERLGNDYVLLIRAHYAVSAKLNILDDGFVKDVSKYPILNDLYAIADMMISDYSSTFVDYSILDRPMFCFAYDFDEYQERRGLYMDIKKELPCEIDYNEDTLINRIISTDILLASKKTEAFHHKYAPYAGTASKLVVDKIEERLRR